MKYTRSGYGTGGAWLVDLDGKHAVFVSNGAGFPEMDTLYVPDVASPRHHSDYSKTLVEPLEWTYNQIKDPTDTTIESLQESSKRTRFNAEVAKIWLVSLGAVTVEKRRGSRHYYKVNGRMKLGAS
jgi:hypothetical protein